MLTTTNLNIVFLTTMGIIFTIGFTATVIQAFRVRKYNEYDDAFPYGETSKGGTLLIGSAFSLASGAVAGIFAITVATVATSAAIGL